MDTYINEKGETRGTYVWAGGGCKAEWWGGQEKTSGIKLEAASGDRSQKEGRSRGLGSRKKK